ncbi:alpha/beta fold hydrolase [Oceanomicrobium pacificus]|uniref:Alpha/beta fold hydrolase n=1 Tax=Oceanomicrobium pacificus TaxID=2692916 RepID=A0A6B0TN53_9RHOB|nr:alpha/beta hydrolase [Oceanomicrobium pacificus]MXU66030.1 alpha/beta fold hydrolase [Oceanomicrobium pacificus]
MAKMQELDIPSGRARLFAVESGEGRPVVCLHAGVADHRMYLPLHAAMSDRARLLSYDRREFGRTRAPDEPFSHVADLAAVIAARDLAPAVLVGCSQGGRIAIDFALRWPDRVAGLFLVAPAVSGMPAPRLDADLAALEAEIDAAYEVEALERINRLERQAWLDGPRAAPGRVSGAARDLFSRMNMDALRQPELLQEQEPPEAWHRVAEIACPVRIFCGTLDFPYKIAAAEYLAAQMPGAAFAPLDGMAHMPFLEDPALMAGRVGAFLDALDGASE